MTQRRVNRTKALWGHNLGRNNFVDGKSSRRLRSIDRSHHFASSCKLVPAIAYQLRFRLLALRFTIHSG